MLETSTTRKAESPESILFAPSTMHEAPSWFQEAQRAAWTTFESLAGPVRKDQPWRFSSVNLLDLSPYRKPESLGSPERDEILSRSKPIESASMRLVFADNRLLEPVALPAELQKRGVIIKPLDQAIREHPDLVRKYFMAQPATLGSAKYAALHRALVSSGTLIFVPRGVALERPIEIFHWLVQENSAVFPHLLLITDELAKVKVIEHFRSADNDQPGFACGVNDLVAGPGAKVTYVCTQNWGCNVRALQMNTTTVDHDAAALSLNVNLGARYSRFESLSRLSGEGGRSDLLAIAIADREQEFDARTLQDHASPHTTSDLLYKNALADRSRSIFGGLIRVEPHAHFTDAYQKVRNLLLSDDAEADSMPGLEILADNVKCSHGATSGQIDEDEMFYLLSRGIPPNVARRLLVTGFLAEVLRRLEDAPIVDHLQKLIEEKFAAEKARSRAAL
jgi:Fe-S cluster assembly protein SufD